MIFLTRLNSNVRCPNRAQVSTSSNTHRTVHLFQESPDILRLLVIYFSSSPLSDLKQRCLLGGVTIREWDFFLTYSTCFLTNMGNYLAFGDLKIVPGISEDKFEVILKLCPLQDQKREGLMSLWEKTRKRTYSLAPGTLRIYQGYC
ncbi:hypothetical protein Mapa_001824 [Marchantia paleacea]|nr:hypothetical protein Mapa_001824 [Marchantia paleacea]